MIAEVEIENVATNSALCDIRDLFDIRYTDNGEALMCVSKKYNNNGDIFALHMLVIPIRQIRINSVRESVRYSYV